MTIIKKHQVVYCNILEMNEFPTWFPNCIICKADRATIISITKKNYISLVTYAKLFKQFKSKFKGRVSWNDYQ